jgi:hypothetical protein
MTKLARNRCKLHLTISAHKQEAEMHAELDALVEVQERIMAAGVNSHKCASRPVPMHRPLARRVYTQRIETLRTNKHAVWASQKRT